jgi:hypothetical protein
MKRDLGLHGQWCAAHRANLVANAGLARLTMPPHKVKMSTRAQRPAKLKYATSIEEAVVTKLNNLCAVLESPSIHTELMANTLTDEPEVVHFVPVRDFVRSQQQTNFFSRILRVGIVIRSIGAPLLSTTTTLCALSNTVISGSATCHSCSK